MSRFPQGRSSLCLAVAAALLVFAGLTSVAGAGTVEVVSRLDPSFASDTPNNASATYASGGTFSLPPTVSADGRFVVFTSKAGNMANGPFDTNTTDDVFLHDRQTGTLTLVSHAVGAPGTVASTTSNSPTISADGRWVAYLSWATNLISGHVERNNNADVFLYDRVTDTTTLVSHIPGSATSTGNGLCGRPSISDDGSFVAYSSHSTDLVAGQTDTSATFDVFLFERATGANTLVSRIPASATTTGNGAANGAVISGDGHWVAFIGWSTNLVSGLTDTNNNEDIYLYERATGAMTLVSHNASSPTTTGNALSRAPVLSTDGSWIAFISLASNIITGADNNFGGSDVFLYERATGTNTLVSHIGTSLVQTGSNTAWGPSISADGRWIAYASYSTNMVVGQSDANGGLADVFLYDRTTGAAVLVSHTSASLTTTGIGNADIPFISRDGSRVTFHGYVRNLVAGQTDTNTVHDVFVYDRASTTVTLASHVPASAATTGNNYSWEPVIAGDGSSVFFRSNATDLLPASVRDKNNHYDVFRFDVATGAVTLLSWRAPGLAEETPNNTSYLGQTDERAVSDDGRWVAFVSNATDVVAGQVDTNSSIDVFLYDRVTRTTALVSHTPASAVTTSNRMSYDPAVSADGRWVVFTSTSTNQVSGQTGDVADSEDVFLYDRQTGAVTLVSHRPGLPATTGFCCSDWAAISGDGNTVVYRSMSPNLVAGQVDTNSAYDVILWDRATNTNLLVTHADSLPATAANGYSWPFAMSRDGAWIAYSADATNLMPAFTNSNGVQSDVFLWERATDTTTLVSRAAGLPTQGANGYPGDLSISADGRYVAHNSSATDLVAGQSGPGGQVFLYDRVAGTNALVSHVSASSTQGANSFSDNPAISADGNWIVFETLATDLVSGITDTNGARDLYVHNRAAGTNLLVSHSSAVAKTTTANNASRFPAISANGGTLVFQTSASNVTGFDGNGKPDVIYYDRASRTATIASRAVTSATSAANSDSFAYLAVNANGDAAIYSSLATNLTHLDLNGKQDVFLYSHKAVANLSITKTDGTDTVSPGQTLTWTITVTNPGPEAVTGATVTDVFPAAVTGVLWSCAATGGGTCPASGAGNLNATVSLPVGATATFTANGILDPGATGTLSNTVQVALPASAVDLDPANNSATDIDMIQ